MDLYVAASPVSPFNVYVKDNDKQVHQEICFMSDLADRVIILDGEYEIENNYITGNKDYITQLVKLFPSLNLIVQ